MAELPTVERLYSIRKDGSHKAIHPADVRGPWVKRRRVLFAVRTGRSGPFAEDAPTTLWPDAATFARFVERHAASWDLPCVAPPVWRELPPAAWTPTDHAAADAAFRDWERRHLELLRAREARGLAFYEPDPA